MSTASKPLRQCCEFFNFVSVFRFCMSVILVKSIAIRSIAIWSRLFRQLNVITSDLHLTLTLIPFIKSTHICGVPDCRTAGLQIVENAECQKGNAERWKSFVKTIRQNVSIMVALQLHIWKVAFYIISISIFWCEKKTQSPSKNGEYWPLWKRLI